MPIIVCFFLIGMAPAMSSNSTDTTSSVQATTPQDTAGIETLRDTATKCDVATAALQLTNKQITENERELFLTQSRLTAATIEFNKRVLEAYKNGPVELLSILASSCSYSDFMSRVMLITSIMEEDTHVIANIRSERSALARHKIELARAKETQAKQLVLVQQQKTVLENQIRARQRNLPAATVKLPVAKLRATYKIAMVPTAAPSRSTNTSRGGERDCGFIFPVAGPHNYIDSWGFARSGGRHHKGCDIMAAKGTPVVACISGIIERSQAHDRGLGGISIYLAGANGSTYYYCHLNCIAPNITTGSQVTAGQIIGYVGSTGNASASAPHLHFEIHPSGGCAADPFHILKAADN
jgi:murein DD-endopeptidase MepM/ murein hydrolase activator NlpD